MQLLRGQGDHGDLSAGMCSSKEGYYCLRVPQVSLPNAPMHGKGETIARTCHNLPFVFTV